MERAAKALRPDPNRPELTEKTWARGNNPRAKLSAPRAQPTETEAVGEIKAATDRRAATLAGGREREPENPTTGKSDTKDNIKKLSTFPYYSTLTRNEAAGRYKLRSTNPTHKGEHLNTLALPPSLLS